MPQDRAELAQSELEALIPSLEERHAALHAELLAERALDEELTSYVDDQREELAQLHADIEEQECVCVLYTHALPCRAVGSMTDQAFHSTLYREQINGNRSKGVPGARPQFERVEQQLQKDRTVLENEKEKELAAKERIAELEAALKDKRTKADLTRMKGSSEILFRRVDLPRTEASLCASNSRV